MASRVTEENREAASRGEKIDELHALIEDMDVALLTTRRPDGHLVTRPMATQERRGVSDLWFVTDRETHKLDEIEADPHVNVGFYDPKSRAWVSVSGLARTSTDRATIEELWEPDWKAWFPDEGGERDGGPGDPRLVLILVEAHEVVYMTSDASRPRMFFEVVKGMVTGEAPDVGTVHHLAPEAVEGR